MTDDEERERIREEQANGHQGELISESFEEEKEKLADQRWVMVRTLWEGGTEKSYDGAGWRCRPALMSLPSIVDIMTNDAFCMRSSHTC